MARQTNKQKARTATTKTLAWHTIQLQSKRSKTAETLTSLDI